MKCAMHNVQYVLCNTHCALCIVQCAMCKVQSSCGTILGTDSATSCLLCITNYLRLYFLSVFVLYMYLYLYLFLYLYLYLYIPVFVHTCICILTLHPHARSLSPTTRIHRDFMLNLTTLEVCAPVHCLSKIEDVAHIE